MSKKKELEVGREFDRLTIIGSLPSKNHRSYSLCKCICGNQLPVMNKCLLSGNTRSCGCLQLDCFNSIITKHGLCDTSEYNIWNHIKQRCYNKNCKAYLYYGGSGIKVCDRWLIGEYGKTGFECFMEDMGKKPEDKTSIDRIDGSRDYCLQNCRWANSKEQSRNRENFCRSITINNETKKLFEWLEILNIKRVTFNWRLRNGWSEQDALLIPPRGTKLESHINVRN
ncbi:MAG: hypothetical protein ACHQ1D_00520 [Nitrososphaerales archaeon]